jgi:TPP-dependent pyruvate/acetoin dehydrogenase alpha subunit
LDMLRTMLCIRQFEECVAGLVMDKAVQTPCHLYSGQEAIAAGVCHALTTKDYVFGTHRSHGLYLAKGGDMNAAMAELFTRETGCSRGRGGSMHLCAPEVGVLGTSSIVAGSIGLGLGTALAADIQGNGRVTVCFFGDGATGEGVLYESMNLAALRKLPIIFVCENNFYATHMPIRECRPGEEVVKIAEAFGISSLRVDGNDLMTVHASACESVSRCRQGRGPFFLECLTYRLRGHVGPDDNIQGEHTDIRPPEELEAWRRQDPIPRYTRTLIEAGLCDEIRYETLVADVDREVSAALRFAQDSPRPQGREELLRYVGE